jgi:undecaprenyl diphosphate synthase
MNEQLPRHIAVILDGNRRWAKEHGKRAQQGHKAGYSTLLKFVDLTFDRGIEYLSVYLFSTENWRRDSDEVGYIMDLALRVFEKDLMKLHKKGVRVHWLGRYDNLSDRHISAIEKAVELTKNNTKSHLCCCVNYGGQQEIVDATKKALIEGVDLNSLDETTFRNLLYAPEVPDIDIVVRSSGEQRISNFMLWRIAYAELLFIDKYWPDFGAEELEVIISEYSNRKRRYGG